MLTSCSKALLLPLVVPVTGFGISAFFSSVILKLLMGLLGVLSPHLPWTSGSLSPLAEWALLLLASGLLDWAVSWTTPSSGDGILLKLVWLPFARSSLCFP
ncbi:hypothetical protein SLEP1_g38861 [Rubroshorea leprosula]|uniref:Secreted protein n=1 Tax=Rubroshorea leprosula TaxID=152421 RepID=A0AAV5KYK6_9ROSI|nr:hypothetical protein SLEP1_g38861 [Rubroshorea leprosula]